MSLYFALSRPAELISARLAQSGEMLFHAQQDTTCTGHSGTTVLLDIQTAGFAHRRDLGQRRLTRRGETLEMRLCAFAEPGSIRLVRGAEFCEIPAASLNDADILAESRCYGEDHKYRNCRNPSHDVNLHGKSIFD